jgi:hypothetical protein
MGRAAEGSVSFGIDHQVKNEKVEPFLGFNVRGSRFLASGIHGCNANDFRRLASDAGGTLDDDAPAAHGSESRDDRELLTSFWEQMTEGKTFAEGFLTTIMETPFTIKDKDSKVEKILGIIGELDS